MKKEVLRLEYLNKKTPNCMLYNVNLNLLEGEILGVIVRRDRERHCLSDLIRGTLQRDAGNIYVQDEEKQVTSREQMEKDGIHVISRNSQLISHMSVAENLFLTRRDFYSGGILNKKLMLLEARDILKHAEMSHISPSTPVRELPLSTRHLIEILKAVSVGGNIIVLNNITSQYTEREFSELKKLLINCKFMDQSVIFLTNKYNPLFEVADRATVIKDGTTVATLKTDGIKKDNLLAFMTHTLPENNHPHKQVVGNKFFSIRHIRGEDPALDISFDLYENEILGILDRDWEYGNSVSNTLFGQKGYAGEFYFNDKQIQLKSLDDAIQNGIGIVQESAHSKNVFYNMSLMDNVTLMMPKSLYHPLGLTNSRIQKYQFRHALEQLNCQYLIDMYGEDDTLPAVNKSTQMKIRLAKWLCINPRVMIFVNPHLSFDDLTIIDFRKLLLQLRKLQIASIIFSMSEEHLGQICDRVLYLERGKILENPCIPFLDPE